MILQVSTTYPDLVLVTMGKVFPSMTLTAIQAAGTQLKNAVMNNESSWRRSQKTAAAEPWLPQFLLNLILTIQK